MDGHSHCHSKEKVCEICGSSNARFGSLLVTCTKCTTSCEHVYCMRGKLKHEVPEDWVCESCTSRESFTSEHFFKLSLPYDAGASGLALAKDMVNRFVRYVNELSPSDWVAIRNDDPQAILELSLEGSLKAFLATKEQGQQEREDLDIQRHLHETEVKSLKEKVKKLTADLENHQKLLKKADDLASELKKQAEESIKQELAKQAHAHEVVKCEAYKRVMYMLWRIKQGEIR